MQQLMMRAIGVGITLLTSLALAEEKIAVKPYRVFEDRVADVVKISAEQRAAIESRGGGGDSGLSVVLELSGKGLTHVFAFGKLEIEPALVDKGEPLKPHPELLKADHVRRFVKIERAAAPTRFRMNEDSAVTVRVPLLFELPPRTATTLTHLDGTLKLLSGQSQNVVISGIAKKTGKLSDPLLTISGLKFTAVPPPAHFQVKPSTAVALEIQGNTDKILNASLADALGKPLKTRLLTDEKQSPPVWVLALDDTLPAFAQLHLLIVAHPETVVVPIHVVDIKLP